MILITKPVYGSDAVFCNPMKHAYALLLLFFLGKTALAQSLTQTVRGRVLDKDTQTPLPGAAIRLPDDSTRTLGTATDANGEFRLPNVPVGRRTFVVSFIGYQPRTLANVIVTTGKEVVLTLDLEPDARQLGEVTVKASRQAQVLNEMGTVSVKAFAVEETGRYAASRDDPARMASNFAGVQGSDDSRNDIVIRGNSPQGVLWRVEGVNIPNPNHFAIPGTQGGSVTMLNAKTLATSDFFTGAFPAEFGNALAGVFDLNLRAGNNEKRESTIQAGLLGLEAAIEGPFSKKSKASYLLAYRYSTLKIFQTLGIQIGTSAVPNYQDLTVKLHFPTKNAGTFSLFALSGKSKVDIVVSGNKDLQEDLYADKDRDQYFRSSTYVVGASHVLPLGTTASLRTVLAHSQLRSWANHDLLEYRQGQLSGKHYHMGYDFRDDKTSLNSTLTKRLGSRSTLKAGFYLEKLHFNVLDSILREPPLYPLTRWERRWDFTGGAWQIQPFAQLKIRASERLTLTVGLNAFIFTLNDNSRGFDPRLGAQYKLSESQSLSFGYGMHHQTQPSYVYFQKKREGTRTTLPNLNMGLTRSQHFVLAYDRRVSGTVRVKVETYYQRLDKIPVSTRPGSSFSLLNQGSSFSRIFTDTTLQNTGVGYNVGGELTIDKSFSRNYYALFTASLYDSKYRGNDGLWRDTDYNGRFALNLLGGGEWAVGRRKRTTLLAGAKLTWAGGRRYGPVNTTASLDRREIVFADAGRNSLQFPNYFRFDVRAGFRKNAFGVSHELALDLINVFGIRNVLGLTYVPIPDAPGSTASIKQQYQLGFLPLFYYKVDF